MDALYRKLKKLYESNLSVGPQHVSSAVVNGVQYEMTYDPGKNVFVNTSTKNGQQLEVKYINPSAIDEFINYFPPEVIEKMRTFVNDSPEVNY